jgi:multiple sugar transport system ATP-binding protein
MGAETFLYLTSGAHTLIARMAPNQRFEPDSSLSVTFDLSHAHLFDPTTEQAL